MMEYKGYIGRVEFDDEAKILHGEIIGIQDVVTFEGESVAEIEKAFHDSVDDYLDFCRERGEDPDKPYSGKFVVRVSPEVHRRLSMQASAEGKSLNAVVEKCLTGKAAECGRLIRSRDTHTKPTVRGKLGRKRSNTRNKQ